VLTAVLPTRNRADYCACQLRFLRDSGFDYPIIVLDASDDDQAACRAAVPELSATANRVPAYRASGRSKRSTAGPRVSQSLRSTRATARMSALLMSCVG
jgi:hypothetical protein